MESFEERFPSMQHSDKGKCLFFNRNPICVIDRFCANFLFICSIHIDAIEQHSSVTVKQRRLLHWTRISFVQFALSSCQIVNMMVLTNVDKCFQIVKIMFSQVVTDSSSDSPLLRSSGSARPRTVYLEKVKHNYGFTE